MGLAEHHRMAPALLYFAAVLSGVAVVVRAPRG